MTLRLLQSLVDNHQILSKDANQIFQNSPLLSIKEQVLSLVDDKKILEDYILSTDFKDKYEFESKLKRYLLQLYLLENTVSTINSISLLDPLYTPKVLVNKINKMNFDIFMKFLQSRWIINHGNSIAHQLHDEDKIVQILKTDIREFKHRDKLAAKISNQDKLKEIILKADNIDRDIISLINDNQILQDLIMTLETHSMKTETIKKMILQISDTKILLMLRIQLLPQFQAVISQQIKNINNPIGTDDWSIHRN